METFTETDRIEALEARLEALERAAGNGRRPAIFDDLMANTHQQVVVVPKSMLADGADQLRALLEERRELAGHLRSLRSRQQGAVRRANSILARLKGPTKGFGVVVPSGEPRTPEEELRAEHRRALRESDELETQIEEAKERLRAIVREVTRDFVALPLARLPINSQRDPGDEFD